MGSDSDTSLSSMFFADRDTDSDASDDRNDVDQVVGEKDEISNIHSEEDSTIEKSQGGILPEKGENENTVKETKGEDEERVEEEQRELQFRELRKKTFESVENVFKPLSEIKDGVPAERIKGAAIAATALTFLASKGVIASSAVGLSAAYISISKSVAGDFLRTIGGVTWDATETTSKLVDQIGIIPRFGEVDKTVVNKYKRSKPIITGSEVDEGELAFIEAEGDDDLSRVLKEAESVIGEADAAIAKAETEQKEKVKRSIEEELRKIAEEALIKEQGEVVDETIYRTEEEEDKVKIADEDRIVEEVKLEAEEKEEDIFVKDEQIIKKMNVKVSDEELQEEDDLSFDDDQFITAVELAQEGIEGKIVGIDDIISDDSAKADWDAAGELANELRKDISETDVDDEDYGLLDIDDDEENDNEFEDVDFEALGKAAREAVEAFERDVQTADDAVSSKKEQWADSMIVDDDDQGTDFGFKDDDIDDGTFVEADRNSAIGVDSPPFIAQKDWSSLKVTELKEELKKRGLKISGRKADLVSLLEKSDLEMSDEVGKGLEFDIDDEKIDVEFEDFDFEELGRQAREAVEMAEANFDEEPTEEMLEELESEMGINGEFLEEPKPNIDFSKMTVAQLKEECRKRSLKVGGRKAELIERIENSITD